MSRFSPYLVGLFIVSLLLGEGARAQQVHLPLPERSSLESGDVLLTITVPGPMTCEKTVGDDPSYDGACEHNLVQGASLRLEGGMLYVTRDGREPLDVRVEGRTVQDLANALAKKARVTASTEYPEVPAEHLADFGALVIPKDSAGLRDSEERSESEPGFTPTTTRNPACPSAGQSNEEASDTESEAPDTTATQENAEEAPSQEDGSEACGPLPATQVQLVADPDKPSATVGFGVVYALDSRPAEATESLLSKGGFQFDLIGSGSRWGNKFQLRGRLGFYSNEGFSESTKVSEGDVSSFVTTAEQFAMAGQFIFGPFAGDHMFLALDGGASWIVLDEFPLPNVALEADSSGTSVGAVRPVEDIAPDAAVMAVEREFNKRVPLGHGFLSVFVRFPALGRTSWYAGAGIGIREVVKRELEIQDRITGEMLETTLRSATDSAAIPGAIRELDLEPRLQARVEEPLKGGYRLMLGFDFDGILNLRSDVIAPLADRDEFEPLVRLVVTKPFDFKGG